MLSKRLEILHVYEKGLQNCFDLKTGAISSACPEIYPKKPAKKGYVDSGGGGVTTLHTHILMSLVKFSWRLVLLNRLQPFWNRLYNFVSVMVTVFQIFSNRLRLRKTSPVTFHYGYGYSQL